jgi:hypothetical protein
MLCTLNAGVERVFRESVFGYISVLPGAFSAYRYISLQNDTTGEGPLQKYFLGETMVSILAALCVLTHSRISSTALAQTSLQQTCILPKIVYVLLLLCFESRLTDTVNRFYVGSWYRREAAHGSCIT